MRQEKRLAHENYNSTPCRWGSSIQGQSRSPWEERCFWSPPAVPKLNLGLSRGTEGWEGLLCPWFQEYLWTTTTAPKIYDDISFLKSDFLRSKWFSRANGCNSMWWKCSIAGWEIAQQEKAFISKLKEACWSPRTHTMEGEHSTPRSRPLTSTNVLWHSSTHTHTHTKMFKRFLMKYNFIFL